MQSYRIQLSGAEEQSFACDEGDTLLSAALRGGVGLPYECNSGGCGSCQIELLEGEIDELWAEAPGLSPRAHDRGRRLACQSVPQGDCVIKARPSNDNLAPIAPNRQVLTFAGLRKMTPDMAEFAFTSDSPARFTPGQFAMLSLPGVTGARAYSMSNLPNDAGEWRFIIKRVPDGKGTGVLFDALAAGAEVPLDGPYGKGWLRTGNGRDIVCIAGGSGLSPVLSILRGAVRAPELAGRAIHLFYGARGPQDLCLDEILQAEPALRERVTVHVAISDDDAPGADQWRGERGFVHELVLKVLGDTIPQFDFYFCGPPPMTDAVQRMLMFDFKVPADQLHFDRFF